MKSPSSRTPSRRDQSGIAFAEQDRVRATIQNHGTPAREDEQVTDQTDTLTIKGFVAEMDTTGTEAAVVGGYGSRSVRAIRRGQSKLRRDISLL